MCQLVNIQPNVNIYGWFNSCLSDNTTVITKTHYREKRACQKHVLSFTYSLCYPGQNYSWCVDFWELFYSTNQLLTSQMMFKIGNNFTTALFESLHGNKSRDLSKVCHLSTSIDKRSPINLFCVFAKFSIVVQLYFLWLKMFFLNYIGCSFYMLFMLIVLSVFRY